MPSMHALLIGIDDYPEVTKLKATLADVSSMREFLIQTLGVPPSQIQTLENDAAKRHGILSGIKRLANSRNGISKGDPILIFFAGHGGTLPKPKNWSANGSEIQCLLAYDAGYDPLGKTVKGVIPDVTLASLLHNLADTKGDNIVSRLSVTPDMHLNQTQTVILDCCHSGSGTRPNSTTRTRDYVFRDRKGKRLTVPEDYDEDIRNALAQLANSHNDSARAAIQSNKFLNCGLRSHVVLAACGATERAEEGSNGFFTLELLRVLREKENSIHNLTYVDLIRSIRSTKT
jgi:hypothetical protein